MSWVKDGAIVKLNGRVGVVTRNPNADGQVKLRKPLPWDVRELTRSIDKMPLRQQEIDEGRGF